MNFINDFNNNMDSLSINGGWLENINGESMNCSVCGEIMVDFNHCSNPECDCCHEDWLES